MADEADKIAAAQNVEREATTKASKATKKVAAKDNKAKKVSNKDKAKAPAAKKAAEKSRKRVRTARPYPVVAFTQATTIGDAIHKHASGEKVRRLRLLELLNLSPTSSSTHTLITNSGKYGITTGSYVAEYLELTEYGKIACDPNASPRAKLEARFSLAINGIAPFKRLYDEYVGKRLADRAVMADVLRDAKIDGVENYTECIDIFITNVKDLNLLRTIGGSENLIPIAQALDELSSTPDVSSTHGVTSVSPATLDGKKAAPSSSKKTNWDSICFYVAPIGDAGSEIRQHSDLFKNAIIEPAMKELGLAVVRADEVGTPGIIATAIIEHIRHARLVIADLSKLNANVFYEIGLRHACRMPIVQIRQKGEKLPFDVGQVNTIEIDNSSLYAFVPQISTFISEVTTLARAALQNPETVSNPVSVFYPDFWKQDAGAGAKTAT